MTPRQGIIPLFSVSLLLASVLVSGDPVKAASAEFVIDISEGGSESLRLQKKLTRYLADRNCPLTVSVDSQSGIKDDSANKASINGIIAIFVPLKPPLNLADFSAKTDPDLPITTLSSANYSQAVVLVRAATGVDKLSSLAGEPISAVTRQSISGYQEQMAMLAASGVAASKERLIFAGNHVGALSLLMHKDVFAAAVDFSVAERWAQTNGLRVIATGSKKSIGGVYFNAKIAPKLRANCGQALSALSREEQPGKSLLKLFPDWLQRLTQAQPQTTE